jgi:hypothetical protein
MVAVNGISWEPCPLTGIVTSVNVSFLLLENQIVVTQKASISTHPLPITNANATKIFAGTISLSRSFSD